MDTWTRRMTAITTIIGDVARGEDAISDGSELCHTGLYALASGRLDQWCLLPYSIQPGTRSVSCIMIDE